MDKRVDDQITINGIDYWVKANVWVYTEENYSWEEIWGTRSLITSTESISFEVNDLELFEYCEEYQDYSIPVTNNELIENAINLAEEIALNGI